MEAIKNLQEQNKKELTLVEQRLIQILEGPIDIIQTLGKHIFNAGGKRLRPLLTLTCAKNFTEQLPDSVLSIAAAVECIHTATLVHDDVIDESKLRRGVKTANALWGNTCSILVGDFLFAKAFELMVHSNNMNVLKMLSQTSAKICQGEVKQMLMTNDTEAIKDDYFYVVDQKTGALFAAACKAGAMLSGANEEDCALIEQYGFHLGRAFQIKDDLLDYMETEENLGKSPGDDYKEGKITLPVIELFEQAPETKTIFNEPTKKHFHTIKNAMVQHNIFEKCQNKIAEITENALENLEKISCKKHIPELKKLILELSYRNN